MAQSTLDHEEHQLLEDIPLAVHRKRRISSGLEDLDGTTTIQPTEETSHLMREAPKTPTKPKKRVRFSEPGPEASIISSSTGLTPGLSRASFHPRSRASSPSRPRPPYERPRRLSLPTQVSGEVQFKPLHERLDDRTKRRISRNGLSEEMNNIDSEKRTMIQLRREIRILKDNLSLAKQVNEEHSGEAEKDVTHSERIQQLEQELIKVKHERSMTASFISAGSDSIEPLVAPELDIFVDNEEEAFAIQGSDEAGVLHEVNPAKTLSPLAEAATQTCLPSAFAETLRAARLDLEYLFPGEITLGLVTEDPKPLLDIMINRMQILKAQTLLAEDTASTTKQQETNLRKQFNAVLEQLDRARKYAEGLSAGSSTEKVRADASQARAQALETSAQAATTRVIELEEECDEKGRSINKLQDALDSYRVEVGKLEILITRMEGDHKIAIANLRAVMDEAVADLECNVVAETIGRREAEQEVVEKDQRINELKIQEQELKSALNEKQQIIQETERIFEEERVGREREVGGLNVKIGELSSNLSIANTKVTAVGQTERVLLRKLQDERDAGIRALEAVRREQAACNEKSEDIKLAHVSDMQRRGAEVAEHNGLLTPVTTGRFKDVEGYVETRRGEAAKKRHRDSGVDMSVAEDEDEIMADVL